MLRPMTRPIRAFLTGLFFLWSALIPSAQEIGELQGYWVGATATPATITFLQCAVDLGNLSAYTFTAQNVGPATPDRYTIVGVGGKDGASVYTVSSVTVGGDSATISVDNCHCCKPVRNVRGRCSHILGKHHRCGDMPMASQRSEFRRGN